MAIHLNRPYIIIPSKHKRYEEHYKIPAKQALVVPIKQLGEEVSCDIRWEDNNGTLHVIHNAVFIIENLVPLNAMVDEKLYGIWEHYYNLMGINSQGNS